VHKNRYAVILVYGTSHAIRAEHLLNRGGIKCKLIPVPRHLSANCGVCVRIERTDTQEAQRLFAEAKLDIEGIFDV
jgi:hypothetical protein